MAPPAAVVAVLLAELAEALAAQLLDLARKARLLDLALKPRLPVPAQAVPVAQLPLAELVVLVAAVPLQHLLSRRSFSAAMARSTP